MGLLQINVAISNLTSVAGVRVRGGRCGRRRGLDARHGGQRRGSQVSGAWDLDRWENVFR